MLDDLPNLTKQQKNLLRVIPITKLEHERNTMLKSLDESKRAHVDLCYAAILLLDHVLISSGFSSGADPKETREIVAGSVLKIHPALTEAEARLVADKVYSYLLQPDSRQSMFRGNYYDHASRIWKWDEFCYMKLVSDDIGGRDRLRIGDAGAIVNIGMLDIDDRLMAEADAYIIKRAIERGKYEEAVVAARRALRRSQLYAADINGHILKLRRSVNGIDWAETVLPILTEAIDHLLLRQEEDRTILEAVAEAIRKLGNDSASSAKAVSLHEIVKDCETNHARLFKSVTSANKQFRHLQQRAFTVTRRENTPDLTDEILPAFLEAPIGFVQEIASPILDGFVQAMTPPFMDIPDIWLNFTEENVADDTDAAELQEVRPLERIEDLYDAEFITGIVDWVEERLTTGGTLSLSQAIEIAGTEKMARDAIRCLCLVFVHHLQSGISLHDTPRISSEIAENHWSLPSEGMGGDDIILTRNRP